VSGTLNNRLLRLPGIELSPVSHTERALSAIGGFPGIYAILQVSNTFVGPLAATFMGDRAYVR